jgi:hypothetical protein
LLPRSLNILFRNLYFMNLILKTKYTLTTEFVLAQVRGNNHWRTSQVRLEILNDRTLEMVKWKTGLSCRSLTAVLGKQVNLGLGISMKGTNYLISSQHLPFRVNTLCCSKVIRHHHTNVRPKLNVSGHFVRRPCERLILRPFQLCNTDSHFENYIHCRVLARGPCYHGQKWKNTAR